MRNVNNLIITIITHDIAPREPSARRGTRSNPAGSGCDMLLPYSYGLSMMLLPYCMGESLEQEESLEKPSTIIILGVEDHTSCIQEVSSSISVESKLLRASKLATDDVGVGLQWCFLLARELVLALEMRNTPNKRCEIYIYIYIYREREISSLLVGAESSFKDRGQDRVVREGDAMLSDQVGRLLLQIVRAFILAMRNTSVSELNDGIIRSMSIGALFSDFVSSHDVIVLIISKSVKKDEYLSKKDAPEVEVAAPVVAGRTWGGAPVVVAAGGGGSSWW
ncbi:hypothetical protein E3N88_24230 [Mikania micrantha]|uniref:Uncharacterized protein n=1 Tax=Mikania micrantha TaxID=192012 RepID=A0A5N6NGN5_9ASTR|nr:hypothetical protein E3N88_24230 [Mikania micrantha]